MNNKTVHKQTPHPGRPTSKSGLEAAGATTTSSSPSPSTRNTAGKIPDPPPDSRAKPGLQLLTPAICKQGATGEIGEEEFVQKPLVASSSSSVCTISGNRKQCVGTLVSSSRRGQKRSKRGFSAMRDAQMIPTLTSMTDQITAWMPDSGGHCQMGMSRWVEGVWEVRNLPTSRPVLSR
jgi:hypothetical protein